MLTNIWQMGTHVERVVSNQTTAIYILCGGASSRMGKCKATVIVDGQTMLEHILQRVAPLDSPTYLVGKPQQQEQFVRFNIPWISDDTSLFHPLNGLVRGLEHASKNMLHTALFLPCDTPFISTESIQKMLIKSPTVAADPKGNVHPLMLHIPIYWIDRAKNFLRTQSSMKAFAEPAGLVTLSHRCLQNFNQPTDLPNLS